ncbi:hypothetical protein GGF31_001355 [Allomyces arbusculus]|nr:hypothetical protein GGF31_001355 [Allomyces arbusculus]
MSAPAGSSSSAGGASSSASASASAPVPSAVAHAASDTLATAAVVLDEANLAFLQRKHELATTLFSQVAEAYAAHYGSDHPRCADVLFRYGRALLNHAIDRSGLLGDAEQLRNATGKREKDLLSAVDEAASAVTGAPAAGGKAGGFFHFGDEGQDEDHEEEGDEEGEEEDDDEPAAEEEEDIETDDFEIAFESLDVARVLYEKMLTGELPMDIDVPAEFAAAPATPAVSGKGKGKAKATSAPTDVETDPKRRFVRHRHAEVVATLGDVSLESESFGQAVDDYTTALALHTALLAPTDRQLAELHYKLALALEYGGEAPLEQALDHLVQARNVMQGCHDLLADQLRDQEKQGTPSTEIAKELAELQGLLPELDLKVQDVKHQIHVRDHPEADEAAIAAATAEGKATLDPTAVPVNDLSAFVKKKSKPVEKLTTAGASSSAAESSSSAATALSSAGAPAAESKKRKLDSSDKPVPNEGKRGGEGSPKKPKLSH